MLLDKMNQSPPIIAADDITIQGQHEEAQLLDSDSRALSCHGRNQSNEIATHFPPPRRFERKAGYGIKFGDAPPLRLCSLNIKVIASYREASRRQLCETNEFRPCVGAKLPKNSSEFEVSNPPYE
jgi:hypothetical protein